MPPKKTKLGDVQILLKNQSATCRVCRNESVSLKSLFEPGSTILEEIQYCTGVLMMEHSQLPSSICKNCYAKLTIAHKFKSTCIQSEESLLKLVKDIPIDVKNELKIEPKEEVEVNFEPDDFEDGDCYFDINEPVIREVVRKRQPKKQNEKLKKDPKLLHCVKCNIQFKSYTEATLHEKKYHLGPWICEVCGKQLNHYTSHYTHMRSHLPPKFSCALCDYKASAKPDLAKHMRVHTGEKSFQCEYCSRKYRVSSHLRSHIDSFHLRLKNHACHRCDRRFYSRQKLNRHIDTHDNIKRFECEICHTAYSRRCQLKKHLLKEHSITMPAIRPGRQRTNLMLHEDKDENITSNMSK